MEKLNKIGICTCDRIHRFIKCPMCNVYHITCLTYLNESYYSHCKNCRPEIHKQYIKSLPGYQFTIFDYIN